MCARLYILILRNRPLYIYNCVDFFKIFGAMVSCSMIIFGCGRPWPAIIAPRENFTFILGGAPSGAAYSRLFA